MKIAVLLGSPHKHGSTNMLAGEFIRGAEENGHDVQVLDVAHMSIKPCLACDHCGNDGDCVQKDDNVLVREALLSVDLAVLVTPIYYYGMSAQLKVAIDRFYSYNTKLQQTHLKTMLITAAYDDDDDVMPYTLEHYRKICRFMSFEDCGAVLGIGCGTPEMTAASKYMAEAYELGKSIK